MEIKRFAVWLFNINGSQFVYKTNEEPTKSKVISMLENMDMLETPRNLEHIVTITEYGEDYSTFKI